MLHNNYSLTSKIVITLLIAIVALAISWRITQYSFNKIKEPVERLSEPGLQLKLVNTIFKDIVQLDQMQRRHSLSNEAIDFKKLEQQTKSIRTSLDSLMNMLKSDSAQQSRILQIHTLLNSKERLFLQYLTLRKQYISNDSLNYQVAQLSDFINNISLRSDSSLFSKETSISATSYEQEDTTTKQAQKTNLWNKLFKKRKEQAPKEVRHFILEQFKVSVDTALLQHEDSVISHLSATISKIDDGRKRQLSGLNQKRAQLDNASATLISELLAILSVMETVELNNINANNTIAKGIINKSLNTNNALLIGFILLSVVLAALIFYDIARSNKYKRALVIAKEQAEELGMVKQKFLSNMSHELRTPLQSIIGYVELMQNDGASNHRNHLNIVHQSSVHLLHIVNEVLDYSRIINDGFVIERKPFFIQPLLHQVVDIIAIQSKTKGLTFTPNFSDTHAVPELLGDPFRLKQILFNLLNNAVKFTDKGSVALDVVCLKQANGFAFQFIVSDTGIGFPISDIQKMFSDFEQLPTQQMQQGSGLGLSIVKHLVEKQGGSISVDSTVGNGSVFKIGLNFPLAKQHSTNAPATIIHNSHTNTGAVWVIDDDRFILELCHEILHNHKIEHTCFGKASEMLASTFPENLQVIFIDIRMPELSGIELVQILSEKTTEQNKKVKFIALTAQVLPDERERILAVGFHDLLRKPFLTQELLSIIGVQNNSEVYTSASDSELIQIFTTDTQKDLIALASCLKHNNFTEASELLHKMASRLGQMGYSQEGKQCRMQEIMLRKGTIDHEALRQLVISIQELL